MADGADTHQFAAKQIDRLLGQLGLQIRRARKSHGADPVHDLRVSIRRFTQALIACGPCFLGKDVKKIRRQLKAIMVPAGEVRDCDIAIKLLGKSKLAEAAAWRSRFQSRRKQAERTLLGSLKRWMERKFSLKWRSKLQAAPAA